MLKIKNMVAFLCLMLVAFLSFGVNHTDVFAFAEKQNCKSCVLIEANGGAVLYENDPTKALPMASVTKLMTILLTLEELEKGTIKLDDKIVISQKAKSMGGSQIFLDENSSHDVQSLLKAVIVASANDASVALAEKISGSEEDFVLKMNKRANSMGLCNTNFENCSGLPAPNHYSCAADLAKIMQQVIKFPLYFSLSQIWMEDYVHPSGRTTTMSNTNKLLKTYKLCDAGKTGSTSEAGYCFCATAKLNQTRLICVVLGAENNKERFDITKQMFEWGFNNFETKKLVSMEDNLSKNIDVLKAEEGEISFTPEQDFWALTKKGESSEYVVSLDVPQKIYAPIKKGDIIGKITVTKNDIVEAQINLICNNDIQSLSILNTIKKVIKSWRK